MQTAAARAAEENSLLVAVGRWIGANRQKALVIAGVLVIVIVLIAWNSLSARQTEQAAGVRLNAARLAFESRNYPLAASELSQVVENYSAPAPRRRRTFSSPSRGCCRARASKRSNC